MDVVIAAVRNQGCDWSVGMVFLDWLMCSLKGIEGFDLRMERFGMMGEGAEGGG